MFRAAFGALLGAGAGASTGATTNGIHNIFGIGARTTARSLTRRDKRKRSERLKRLATALAMLGGAYVAYEAFDAVMEYRQPMQSNREKVVVLGAGFGALSFAQALDHKRFEVTMVAPRAHFLYTPALPSALFGAQDMHAIVEPVRTFRARARRDFTFYEAACDDVDLAAKTVHCKPVQADAEPFNLKYDYLIVATGAKNDTLGVPGVKEHCLFLDSLNDARRLRNRVLDALESASLPSSEDEAVRREKLNFVVVGGSPVARAVAQELQSLAFVTEKVKTEFPKLKDEVHVTLLTSNDHVHNYYDHAMSKYYSQRFKRNEGAERIASPKHTTVVSVNDKGVTVQRRESKTSTTSSQEVIPARTVVWVTGKAPSAFTQKLAAKLPKEQRNHFALVTDHALRLLGTDNVYAVGDCTTIDQRSLMAKWEQFFKDSDVNHDGVIDRDEFRDLCQQMGKRYPALLEVANRSQELFSRGDMNADGKLNTQEFEDLMRYLDETLTRYPASASTAAQQGFFLADQFNSGAHKISSGSEQERAGFRYKHIGGYEYVGAEDGLVERGSKGNSIVSGTGAWWLWNNVYFSSVLGLPMRMRMAISSAIYTLFGSDVSRY